MYKLHRDVEEEVILEDPISALTWRTRQMNPAIITREPYRDCTGLVIHLNPPMFSFQPAFRTAHMREATEPAATAFREVWLVRDQGVLLWKDGSFIDQIHDDF